MCELLAISANKETSIRFSEAVMRAHSREHKSGWGVAFYPGDSKHCTLFKEAEAMHKSKLLPVLNDQDIIRSKIILNHIRKSTSTDSYENTHPFSRELFGEQWTFIHNGAHGLDRYFHHYLEDEDFSLSYIPIGLTGSDKAFCILLNELKKKIKPTISTMNEAGNVCVVCSYRAVDAFQTLYESCLAITESGADLNMILSNGDVVIAFHSGYNHLHYLLRDYDTLHGKVIELQDVDYDSVGHEQPHLVKGPGERAAIIATEKLTTGENWIPFVPGEMIVFKKGDIVARSQNGRILSTEYDSSSVTISDIEVYDSSKSLDQKRSDHMVIGLPAAVRQQLDVDIGVTILVSNAHHSSQLEVHQTAKELLHGECKADNPIRHVCLPPKVRDLLHLQEINANHRSGFEQFSKKFTPVSIHNKRNNESNNQSIGRPVTNDDLHSGKKLPVMIDGIPGTCWIQERDFACEKIVVTFDRPHPVHGDGIYTKYFYLKEPGNLHWGHDDVVMEIYHR